MRTVRGLFFLFHRGRTCLLLEEVDHFARFGVAPERLLAENPFVVHDHFKATTAGRNQGQFFNNRCEFLQELCRQTDGTRGVVSLYAVFDTDRVLLHGIPPTVLKDGLGYPMVDGYSGRKTCKTHYKNHSRKRAVFANEPEIVHSHHIWDSAKSDDIV